MKLETLKCPRCGADIPVPPVGARSVRCEYCGNESRVVEESEKKKLTREELEQIVVRVVPPASATPPPSPSHTGPRPKPASPALAIAVVLVLLGLIGGAIALVTSIASGGNSGFQWRDPPVVTTVDGDGVEDFVGTVASRSETDYPIYLTAFSGATQKQLWRYGPLGKNSYELKYAAIGSTIVLTDAAGKVHLIDAATGKEAGTVALSDKADELCTTAGPSSIWIETADQKGTLIDVATRSAKATERPATCPKRGFDCDHQRNSGCVDARDVAPEVPGFDADFVLFEGDDAIAVGKKSPGTSIPMAVAFDLKTKAIQWKKNLVPDPPANWDARLHATDLKLGRLITNYVAADGVAKGSRLMSLDAKTGAVQWDVPVPNSEDGSDASDMTVSESRIYLPHWTWLELFDVKTGTHVTTLGAW